MSNGHILMTGHVHLPPNPLQLRQFVPQAKRGTMRAPDVLCCTRLCNCDGACFPGAGRLRGRVVSEGAAGASAVPQLRLVHQPRVPGALHPRRRHRIRRGTRPVVGLLLSEVKASHRNRSDVKFRV